MIAKIFAESFLEDPLYEYMLPNRETRQKVMGIFFEIYLDIFGEYGELLVSSKKLEAAAYIYYENRFKNSIQYKIKLIKGVLKSYKLLKYIGLQSIVRIGKTIQGTSSAWVYKAVEGDYVHIDLIGVKLANRGMGKGSQFIQYAIKKANKERLPITLETQNESNIRIYSQFGFEVVEMFEFEGLTQYCMIYPNK